MSVLDFLTVDRPFSLGFSSAENNEFPVALVRNAAQDVSQG